MEPVHASMVLVAGFVASVTALSHSREPLARLWVCIAMAILFCVYFSWRTTMFFSMEARQLGESVWQTIFYVAEAICFIEGLLFYWQMARVRDNVPVADTYERHLRAVDPSALPPVDVFIATYNEDWAILEKTLVGALALDWPKDKLRIMVLDDGRRDWLRERCLELGVEHVTRPDSKGKKAGNHNHALSISSAPVILSLDADFVPFPNFLLRTIGFFEDPRVAIVQTPQTYYNVDAMRASMLLESAPDELSFFYREEQPARDALDAAFYCGSCAVIRRTAIEAIGGFVTQTDIEDLATSMKLVSQGYVIRYLDETLSVGLAAESLSVLHDQRNRWCRGAFQALYMPFGPFGRHQMNLAQRLFFRQSHWIVWSLLPIVFALAPLFLWAFDWRVFESRDGIGVLLMPLALFATSAMAMTWLTRGRWHFLISPAMQVFLAVELLPTSLSSLIKPFGKPLIAINPVTPKGDAARTSLVDTRTFVMLAGLAGAILAAFAHALLFDGIVLQSVGEIAASLFWTLYVLLLLTLACTMCFERPYRRQEERFRVRQEVGLRKPGGILDTLVLDDVSVVSGRLRGPVSAEICVGDEVVFCVPTIGEIPACVTRVDRESRITILAWPHIPDVLRHRLIRAIYTDAQVQAQVDSYDPNATTRQTLERLARSAGR